MTQPVTISKNLQLPAAQDYNFLRKEGLKYIESLASDIWTDFNEHDPGITILEALCYALTELGYRTGFDIKDILTDDTGNIPGDQCFFTAKDILTCHPLILRDYRKLLIDLEQVQNAWMVYEDVGQEINFYADCANDKLSFDDGSQAIPDGHKIRLSGLYSVLLDLESSLQWGDLNNTNITYRMTEGNIQDTVITVLFHYIEALDKTVYENIISLVVDQINYATNIQSITFPTSQPNYHWVCNIMLSGITDPVTLIIRIDSLIKREDRQNAFAYLQTLFTGDFIHAIFVNYQKKYALIQQTLLNVKMTLLANRNLSEDFLQVKTVKDQDIALCADIDVAPDADIEKISANIFYYIQEYFSPTVRFYFLKDLIAKGITTDNIFDGPVLSHGFIDNDEIDSAQLRRVIRSSDLVNIIMGIDGVLAVRNLVMTKYDEDGEPVLPSQAWCLEIAANCKGILNIDRSKFIFYKGKIPLKAKIAESLDTLQYLQAINEGNKLYGAEDDIPVPAGQHYDLADYYSIQNDLPQTYGVGIAGLPHVATSQRKAQAKQLKAYLLFYDQLLANFFSQLNGIDRLLSIDDSVIQTYFTQFLGEAVPPFYQDGIKGVTDIYTNVAQMQTLMDGAQINSIAWENLVETRETFYERRNGFLDHLLARFAESFNSYVLMMYQVHFDLKQSDAVNNDSIIKTKINFLKNYPVVSASRGRAFDYCTLFLPVTDPPTPDWTAIGDAGNISGLEKRVALLTGIALPTLDKFTNHLFCYNIADIVETGSGDTKQFAYIFYDENENGILQSVKQDYASQADASAAANIIVPFLSQTNYYYAQKQADDTYRLFIVDNPVDKTNLLATDNKIYATLSDANSAKNVLANTFRSDCNKEGMYLVEHLLLRPREVQSGQAGYDLMEVCLGKDCHFCGQQDPYSFRASVILPYWPSRFMDMNFRKYFEDTIRAEAPAHVALKICWINNTSMRHFEKAYKDWLKALADLSADGSNAAFQLALRDANNVLVYILQHLHTEYPVATLHDCEESENTNMVILGSTQLGTYKN